MMHDSARPAGVNDGARSDEPDRAPSERPEAYVYPGQLVGSAQPLLASTILGTCVSVCMFDPGSGIGGLNHFMLPHAPRSSAESDRFGDVATRRLADVLDGVGATRRRLQAKVFGGMQGRLGTALMADLGARNITIAFETLRTLGIPVLVEDVGGPKSRKLLFRTSDGSAWVRYF